MYKDLSPNSLRDLHSGIWRAMMDDDMRPASDRLFGVRETSDWRQHGDLLEAEMDRIGLWYPALPW